MDFALLAAALALGLAGLPHCVAMCAAPCAAVTGRAGPAGQAGFHVMRVASYAAVGALAAASVGTLGVLADMSPMLKPLWSAVHAAALALGLWLALKGRQPAWLERVGRRPALAAGKGAGAVAGGGQVMLGPRGGRGGGMGAMAAGALWAAWPCGLLQSAVLVAALANSPWGGAGVMAAFAVTSGLALTAAPWLWRRLGAGAGRGAGGPRSRLSGWVGGTAGVRLAGVLLVAASGWALTSGVWHKIAAYCGF